MTQAHIVILGAGLGGTIAAFELRHELKDAARITVVNKGEDYWFAPSNPWVAVGWRERRDINVHLPPVLQKRGIAFNSTGARTIDPAASTLQLGDGTSLEYDYLVIATGPELAFDEIEGFGPTRNTVSICEADHAASAYQRFEELCRHPQPIVVGAAQGASCFGPAYEMAMLVDTELKRRKLRDKVPMTFVTPEPYIGHLGLDGVGDTKSLLESELRDRHIKWITNAKVAKVDNGLLHVEEFDEGGALKQERELEFGWCMLMPPFRGVEVLRGIEGLTNPRGFVIVDSHQRNPRFPNIFALGVCIAIAPTGSTAVPVGVPKTGFMIESMASAITKNLQQLLDGRQPTHEATWNAICLADFGDGGVAFIAQPQIPPRNVNWSSEGKWVHLAKVGFEKYFLRKIRKGEAEPLYEKLVLQLLGVNKVRSETEGAS